MNQQTKDEIIKEQILLSKQRAIKDLKNEIEELKKVIRRQKEEINYHLKDKDNLYKEIDILEDGEKQ